MSVETRVARRAFASRHTASAGVLAAGLGAFGAYHLGLALYMAIAPRSFFTNIGPFGALNTHYIRDTATFNAAIGVALLVAVRRVSWRVPCWR